MRRESNVTGASGGLQHAGAAVLHDCCSNDRMSAALHSIIALETEREPAAVAG